MGITITTCKQHEDNSSHILSDNNIGAFTTIPDLSDGDVYAFILYSDATGIDGPTSLSGGGFTWTQRAYVQNPNNLTGILITQASGTGSSADLIVDTVGNVSSGAWVNIVQFVNADTLEQTLTATDASGSPNECKATFATTPLNGGPATVGETYTAFTDPGMFAAIEVSDGGGDSLIAVCASVASATSSAAQLFPTTLTELDRATLLKSSVLGTVAEAAQPNIGYWGILLKTAAATAGGSSAEVYRNHRPYRDTAPTDTPKYYRR